MILCNVVFIYFNLYLHKYWRFLNVNYKILVLIGGATTKNACNFNYWPIDVTPILFNCYLNISIIDDLNYDLILISAFYKDKRQEKIFLQLVVGF